MKLKKVEIHKYKSFEKTQEFDIEDAITILVGMNESGKTSALEVIAKTNYFQDGDTFKFNVTHDYPRREKKMMNNHCWSQERGLQFIRIPQMVYLQLN